MDTVKGCCNQMCPVDEVQLREQERLLHPFEVDESSDEKRPKADPRKVVKQYSRSAAGQRYPHPEELRTPSALVNTVHYLMYRIVPKKGSSFEDVYEFVFDRLRAVRQELVIQDIDGATTVLILEAAVRFYIYSSYRLCESSATKFDRKIHDTDTQVCLKRLLCLYKDYKELCQNRKDFEALYLLWNLDSTEAVYHALSVKSSLRDDSIFGTALEMSLLWWIGNHYHLIKLSRKLPVIFQCAFHKHLKTVQRQALCVMSSGYNSKTLRYPINHLTSNLGFMDEQDAEVTCKACGLDVSKGAVLFQKAVFNNGAKLTAKRHHDIETQLGHISVAELLFPVNSKQVKWTGDTG